MFLLPNIAQQTVLTLSGLKSGSLYLCKGSGIQGTGVLDWAFLMFVIGVPWGYPLAAFRKIIS